MWKALKDAIIQEEPGTSQPKTQGTTPASASVFSASPGQSQGVQMASPDNEFVAVLRKAVKARPTPFTALLDAADRLAGIIPDPNMRLKAAFASVAGEGRGLREVLGAIDAHVADIEGQRLQFSRSLENQRVTALSALEAEKSNLDASNKSAQQQIEQMSQTIQQLQQLISTNTARGAEISVKISTETSRFTGMQSMFDSALSLVKQDLEGQRAAVTSTLNS